LPNKDEQDAGDARRITFVLSILVGVLGDLAAEDVGR
jgi:hypothetical protein